MFDSMVVHLVSSGPINHPRVHNCIRSMQYAVDPAVDGTEGRDRFLGIREPVIIYRNQL